MFLGVNQEITDGPNDPEYLDANKPIGDRDLNKEL